MLAFFVCIVLGIMAGGLSAMWTKVGIFLLGGWLGGTVGMMLYDAVIAQLIGHNPKASIAFWSVVGFFIAFGAILTTYLYKHAIAVASSFIGAYCLVRVSLLFLIVISGCWYLYWWIP
jgi:hypothetical protein